MSIEEEATKESSWKLVDNFWWSGVAVAAERRAGGELS